MKKVISTLLSLSMVIGVVAPVQASEVTNSIGSVKEDITNEAVTGQDTAQGQKSEYQEAGTDENGTNVYLTKISTYTVGLIVICAPFGIDILISVEPKSSVLFK